MALRELEHVLGFLFITSSSLVSMICTQCPSALQHCQANLPKMCYPGEQKRPKPHLRLAVLQSAPKIAVCEGSEEALIGIHNKNAAAAFGG